jgi:hypothetical protein
MAIPVTVLESGTGLTPKDRGRWASYPLACKRSSPRKSIHRRLPDRLHGTMFPVDAVPGFVDRRDADRCPAGGTGRPNAPVRYGCQGGVAETADEAP